MPMKISFPGLIFAQYKSINIIIIIIILSDFCHLILVQRSSCLLCKVYINFLKTFLKNCLENLYISGFRTS